MAPNEEEESVKVVIKLEKDEDDYPPADYEGLWATALGENLYRIDNIPFFARGIAWGDVVEAIPQEGELRLTRVVRSSGHSTVRLIIYDKSEVPVVQELVAKRGCACERSHIPGLISVDVPPSVPYPALKQLLDEGESQERWGYEEGCLGQPKP